MASLDLAPDMLQQLVMRARRRRWASGTHVGTRTRYLINIVLEATEVFRTPLAAAIMAHAFRGVRHPDGDDCSRRIRVGRIAEGTDGLNARRKCVKAYSQGGANELLELSRCYGVEADGRGHGGIIGVPPVYARFEANVARPREDDAVDGASAQAWCPFQGKTIGAAEVRHSGPRLSGRCRRDYRCTDKEGETRSCAQTHRDLCAPHNASAQLQAVDLKARDSAPLVLHFKETNCDGYLNTRA